MAYCRCAAVCMEIFISSGSDFQGGVEMKLLAICFYGGQARTFVDVLEADAGVPRDCLPAAMDDRVGWRKKAMGSRLRST